MNRSTDKKPHYIGLYLNGEYVTTATMRWTDPRFTKAEDLLALALQEMKDREAYGRRHDDKPSEWNQISINFGWMDLYCDRDGTRLHDLENRQAA